MSAYDRRTGVKNLRVRGLEAVRFCAVLKAAGLNLIRAAAVRRARRKAKQADNSLAGTFLKLFAVVKERIYKIVSGSGQVLANSIDWRMITTKSPPDFIRFHQQLPQTAESGYPKLLPINIDRKAAGIASLK